MSETDKILKQILESQKKMQEDISLIKTQQKEHGDILSSLKSASEFHKADTDNLTHEIANLQGTVKNISNEMTENFSDLKETNKSLLEMYGSHEAEIRTLRRRPV